MKMQFHLVVDGGESMEKKFQETASANPNLTMDLIRAFGQIVMMAFRLTDEDKVTIASFRAGKIADEQVPEQKDDKKVEN